jgi:hypothetical protein
LTSFAPQRYASHRISTQRIASQRASASKRGGLSLFRSTIYSRQLAKPPRRGFRTFNHDPYLDAWRLGEVTENLRGLSIGELCAVEINADLDAAIGGAREALALRRLISEIPFPSANRR